MTVVEEWVELLGGGGGGLKSQCIKMNYSDPTRAESRERTSTLAESSRVLQCSILIGWRLGWRNTRLWLADEVAGFFRARFWLADEVWGYFVLNSDWLPTIPRFWTQAGCVRQCIKIGSWVVDSFSALWDYFENKKIFELIFTCRPTRAGKCYGAE